MKIRNIAFILFSIVVLLSSCKSKKAIIATPTTPIAETENLLIQEVVANQPTFITANISKLNMTVSKDGKEFSSAGACKMYRDSVIQFSIQPFMGIELFRLELTPEAVYLFDKTSNKYYHMIYDQLSEQTGVLLTFYDFQSLLSNQLFCVGNRGLKDIHAVKKGEAINLSYENEEVKQSTLYQNKSIRNLLVQGKKDHFTFSANYDRFQQNNEITSPGLITINFDGGGQNLSLEISISKIEFNREMKIDLTNPLRYNQAPINSLLNNPIFK